jgi:hypothetical protein
VGKLRSTLFEYANFSLVFGRGKFWDMQLRNIYYICLSFVDELINEYFCIVSELERI